MERSDFEPNMNASKWLQDHASCIEGISHPAIGIIGMINIGVSECSFDGSSLCCTTIWGNELKIAREWIWSWPLYTGELEGLNTQCDWCNRHHLDIRVSVDPQIFHGQYFAKPPEIDEFDNGPWVSLCYLLMHL